MADNQSVLANPTSMDTGSENSDTGKPNSDSGTSSVIDANKPIDDGSKKSPDSNAAPVIPDTYEFTVAEGSTVSEMSKTVAGAFAKEHGLTQAQAQAHFDNTIKNQRLFAEDMVAMAAEKGAELLAESKADPLIGGDKWNKTLANVKTVMDRPEYEALKDKMEKSGLGNDKDFIKLVSDFGAIANEDTHEDGRKAPASETDADIMYPNLKK